MNRSLAQSADARRGVMVPMRDGIGLSTNVYTPKNANGPLPTILWKTPYNEHKMRGSTLRYAVEAVERGYAFIVQNERGRYFSEGKYEILGHPQTDGYDALTWIAKQPWSNGKVGTLGCSSSAEWQLALAAQNHPAHAAMVPMSAGAGIGKVGRFQEQGNWYTGGVPRTLFFVWLYGVDNPLRAQLPATLDEKMRARDRAVQRSEPRPSPRSTGPSRSRICRVDTMLTEPGRAAGDLRAVHRPHAGRSRPGARAASITTTWAGACRRCGSTPGTTSRSGPNLELFNHARAVEHAIPRRAPTNMR